MSVKIRMLAPPGAGSFQADGENHAPGPDGMIDIPAAHLIAALRSGFVLASPNGRTADRPVEGRYAGLMFYDRDLAKPVWWNGTGWADATGAAA
jgi:hypothetical protein